MEESAKKEYELAVVINDAATEKNLDEFLSTSAYGIEITGKEPARMLQLAYPIKKQTAATLMVYYLLISSDKISQFKKDLSFQTYVLRSMVSVKQAVDANETKSDNVEKQNSDEAKKTNSEISSTEELAKKLEELK